jgi:hypothetical protein
LYAKRNKQKYLILEINDISEIIFDWHDPITNLMLSALDQNNEPDFKLNIVSNGKVVRIFTNTDFRYFEAKNLIKVLKERFKDIDIQINNKKEPL